MACFVNLFTKTTTVFELNFCLFFQQKYSGRSSACKWPQKGHWPLSCSVWCAPERTAWTDTILSINTQLHEMQWKHWSWQNSARSVSQLWISANFSKNQHVSHRNYFLYSLTPRSVSLRGVWLCAVLALQSLTPGSVSLCRVWNRAVLACVESLISQISSWKQIFKKHHFNLFFRGPGRLD